MTYQISEELYKYLLLVVSPREQDSDYYKGIASCARNVLIDINLQKQIKETV
jgi:hypothetical protein